jgi:signal transduction histidine kinase
VTGLDLPKLNLSNEQLDALRTLQETLRNRAESPVYTELDPLVRSDLEYDLEEWLESNGIEQPWEMAPLLVNAGYDSEALAGLAGTFDPAHLPELIKWLTATYTSLSLLTEIRSSTKRLSEIIQAMKQSVYLDQAPIHEVDVHEGLNNTLILLGHRLKEGIRVTRDYAQDLPQITAYGNELTQVWTNLIDNAIVAMNGKGNLTIHTRRQDEHVIVELTDDGPGIPEDIQERVFEPFYTTKAPGEGTGLGLHISHNIIVNNHGGQIRLASKPGQTTFEVWLPIESELVN